MLRQMDRVGRLWQGLTAPLLESVDEVVDFLIAAMDDVFLVDTDRPTIGAFSRFGEMSLRVVDRPVGIDPLHRVTAQTRLAAATMILTAAILLMTVHHAGRTAHDGLSDLAAAGTWAVAVGVTVARTRAADTGDHRDADDKRKRKLNEFCLHFFEGGAECWSSGISGLLVLKNNAQWMSLVIPRSNRRPKAGKANAI
jgi:hypothetical protein